MATPKGTVRTTVHPLKSNTSTYPDFIKGEFPETDLRSALVDAGVVAVGENGAFPRTKLLESNWFDVLELSGKFNAYTDFMGAVE